MGVFEIEDAPGKQPRDDDVEASSDCNARAILLCFVGIVAPLRVVSERPMAIVPPGSATSYAIPCP